MDPTVPSFTHFDDEHDEAQTMPLRRRIADQFDEAVEEAEYAPLRRRRAQRQRLSPQFSEESEDHNSFHAARTPDKVGYKNACNYREMDDEVDVNYAEYKYAFDELKELDQ